MESTVGNALVLLGVGMLSVFFILSMVVLLGNVLIRLLNRLPEKQTRGSKPKPIEPHIETIISKTVHDITMGQGIVSRIDRIK